MKLPRRKFQRLAAGVFALPTLLSASHARAQTWPAQPVRLIVGFAAGQAIDILARLIGQSLTEQLGQQFVVENKPGAGGNIGGEQAAIRSISAARSRTCCVSAAARSNSARASMVRPSFTSRSPRAAGSRW